MTGWPEFAEGLAEHLAAMPVETFLIIEEADGPRYVQFRQFDDALYVQLVGDGWLEPALQVGDSGARRLVEAGWQVPDVDNTDNWWIDWTWPLKPARYRELASMVLTGLRDVHAIAHPGDLVYTAWNADTGDRDMELPGLGLPRRSSE